MIEIRGVGKSYRIAPGPGRKAGAIEAVRAVSASLASGEVVGIVGPNGAGKTTLFGLLLGFLEATAGAIEIDGVEPRSFVRSHGANYLPERFQIPRDWPVRAALAALLSLDKSAASVDDVLRQYDLDEYAGAPAHTLSRGTMQRLGIAQALATPRRLVVLDEPAEGLDPVWRVRLRESIRRLRAPDRIILVASHDLVEIERIADRVIILGAGRVEEVMDMNDRASSARVYTIALTAAHPAIEQAFDSVERINTTTFTTTVKDAADLSARIAALIELGGQIVSVTPGGLEERLTRTVRQEPS